MLEIDFIVKGVPGVTATRRDDKNSVVKISLSDDDYRKNILEPNGGIMSDGTKISIAAEKCKYTNDTMDILRCHTGTWRQHWKANDAAMVERNKTAIRWLIEKARQGSPTARARVTVHDIRRAARSFKKKTAIGSDH